MAIAVGHNDAGYNDEVSNCPYKLDISDSCVDSPWLLSGSGRGPSSAPEGIYVQWIQLPESPHVKASKIWIKSKPAMSDFL